MRQGRSVSANSSRRVFGMEWSSLIIPHTMVAKRNVLTSKPHLAGVASGTEVAAINRDSPSGLLRTFCDQVPRTEGYRRSLCS